MARNADMMFSHEYSSVFSKRTESCNDLLVKMSLCNRFEFFSTPFGGNAALTTLGHMTIYSYQPKASNEHRPGRLGILPSGAFDFSACRCSAIFVP